MTTDVVDRHEWGKDMEKQLENVGSWKEEMYLDGIPNEYSRFRELLEKYSKVPPDEVVSEIFKIREKAWAIANYPCIGHFMYLPMREFDGNNNTEMYKAIDRLKAPGSQDTFLEIGGFLFHTLRRLVYEGVDSTRLYGTDLHAEFFELGYQQFRDRETLKSTFVTADLLLSDAEYEASAVPKTLDGNISLIHATNFFHLFTWDAQIRICERIVRFFRRGLSADTPAVLFGFHAGSLTPGEYQVGGTIPVFLHGEDTFQSLWDEVGKKTGTNWKVSMQATTGTEPYPNALNEVAREMRYVVTQIS